MNEASIFWYVVLILDQELLGLRMPETVCFVSHTIIARARSTGMHTCREDTLRDWPFAVANIEQIIVLAGNALAVVVVVDIDDPNNICHVGVVALTSIIIAGLTVQRSYCRLPLVQSPNIPLCRQSSSFGGDLTCSCAWVFGTPLP
jgi:hypothetical protein